MTSLKILLVSVLLALVFSPAHEPSVASSGERLPPIVFVSRNTMLKGLVGDVPGSGPTFRSVIVGGKLMIRDGKGTIRALIDSSKLIDVADPSVSWDGKRIIFSGVEHADSNWRIFEIGVDGSGFRQLTFSNRDIDLSQFGASAHLFVTYDDFDPCYLPSGKIVFASTRYPSMAMIAQVRTSNLYVMESDGTQLRRITSERNGGEEPTIDPVTGKIVYARWWGNLDRPSNSTRNNISREDGSSLTDDIGNIWHAVAINPDGDLLRLYAGFLRTRYGAQTYKPAVMRDGRLLSAFSPRTSLVGGSGGWGIRWFNPGADFEHHVVGVRSDESLRQLDVVHPPYATDPIELSPTTILFSHSSDGEDYGICSVNLQGGRLTTIVDFPGSLELEPQLVVARPVPPIIAEQFVTPVSDLPPTEDPETYGRNDFFRFDCMNIFTNGKVDEPMPDAPRIAQDLTIQFFMNSQRQSGGRPDPSILLKTAPVFYMGGVHEHDVPAEVPLFEQLVNKDGKVHETTDGKFAHVAGFNFERLGSGTKCVGCHIGHSMLEVPKNGEDAEWFNAAPSARVIASSEFRAKDGRLFPAQNVVDRQARIGGDSVIWVSAEGKGSWIELRWPVPIEARQFVLYNIPKKSSDGTTILVQNCRILLYYHGNIVKEISSTGGLKEDGTAVSFIPTKIDAAKLIITKYSGSIHRMSLAGLAEVETIARLFFQTSQ